MLIKRLLVFYFFLIWYNLLFVPRLLCTILDFFNNNLIHLIKSFLSPYFSRAADTKNKRLKESKAFSMSTVSKIPSICNKSVIFTISEIILSLSLINIVFKYTIWFLLIKLFKIIFNLMVITYEINLVSIFNIKIRLQFLINRSSVLFLG